MKRIFLSFILCFYFILSSFGLLALPDKNYLYLYLSKIYYLINDFKDSSYRSLKFIFDKYDENHSVFSFRLKDVTLNCKKKMTYTNNLFSNSLW